jgi:hypothetical protein
VAEVRQTQELLVKLEQSTLVAAAAAAAVDPLLVKLAVLVVQE